MFKNLLIFLLLVLAINLNAMDQRLFKYLDAKSDYVKATQEKDQSAAFDLALFYDSKKGDSKKGDKQKSKKGDRLHKNSRFVINYFNEVSYAKNSTR